MIELLKWMFLLVLLVAGAWVSLRFYRDSHGEMQVGLRGKWIVGAIAVVLAYGFLIMPAVGQISAGHRGVVLEFGRVTGRVLDEGIYFVKPFANTVQMMSVQTQAYETPASAASNDLQTVNTKVTLNYFLDPAQVTTIYQTLRRDYGLRIVAPAVQEAVKANTARFTAEQLIKQRTLVKQGIEQSLRERLAEHGMVVDTINITDFDFSAGFNAEIEAKVTAEQRALTAENDLRRIEIEAKQTIERAKAEATAIQIRGDALKQNQQLVQLEAVQRWDGHMPQIILGDSVPFISIPGLPSR